MDNSVKKTLVCLANLTQIPITMFDHTGKETEGFGDACKFCSLFNGHIKKEEVCKNNRMDAIRQSKIFGEAYISFCPANLITIAMPTYKNGKQDGGTILGPILMEYPDIESVDEILRKYEISARHRTELLNAMHEVPLILPEKVRYLASILQFIIGAEKNLEYKVQMAKSMQQSAIHDFLEQTSPLNDTQSKEALELLIQSILAKDKKKAHVYLNKILVEKGFVGYGKMQTMQNKGLDLLLSIFEGIKDETPEVEDLHIIYNSAVLKVSSVDNFQDFSFLMLNVVNSFLKLTFNGGGNYSLGVSKILKFIHANYASDIKLADIADIAERNTCYISTQFKKEVGKSFSDYLSEVRIKKAKILLSDSNLTLSEITFEVGFSCQSYFSDKFKKYVGMTPSEYRMNK